MNHLLSKFLALITLLTFHVDTNTLNFGEELEDVHRKGLKASWFLRGCADVTSLCSAVQNHHTAHLQTLYWAPFSVSSSPPKDGIWGSKALCLLQSACSHAQPRGQWVPYGLWSYFWIAPGWPVTVALHKFLLSRDGILKDEGLFTFLLPTGPGKDKRISFHLKTFWNVPSWEKHFPAFTTSLDPKLVGFQPSQPELYEKLSFDLVVTILALPQAPGFKGNFENIIFV